MCMGCASNADFLVTSGILGAASLRVAARRVLPTTPRWARKVSDEEAAGFVSSLQPTVDATEPTAPADDHRHDPRVLADR
jgi:hypothetical protein